MAEPQELATLEGDPNLVSQVNLDTSSSDIAKLIDQANQKVSPEPAAQPTIPEAEPPPQATILDPALTADDPIPEESQVLPPTGLTQEPLAPEVKSNTEMERLQKTNDLLMELLRKQQSQSTPVKEEPKPKILTKEEEFEQLQDLGPREYYRRIAEEQSQPLQAEIKVFKESKALSEARSVADFVRLEPAIQKLREMHPELVRNKNPLKVWEGYYLMAKGLETQNLMLKAQDKKKQEEDARLKAKREASLIPTATKKIPAKTAINKPLNKMNSKELEVLIRSQTG